MKGFLEQYGLIFCVLCIGIFFRFYHLSSVPPSPSLDEVSIGYNAYSILKTGADEYGTRFPLLLRAYDDWRPALYVYLVIPFVSILGLTALAVRLPSILLSIILLPITYGLVYELFGRKPPQIKIGEITLGVPLFAMALLAISPWHIYISRLGHEANAGLAAIVIAIYFFLRVINEKQKTKWFVFSAVTFAVALYTYQSQKLIVPVLLLALEFCYRKILFEWRKVIIVCIIIGVLLSLPIVFVSFSPEGLMRLRGTSAFSSDQSIYYEYAKKFAIAKERGDVFGILMNHRYVVNIQIFIKNYFMHFNWKWLFTGSDVPEAHKVPRMGLLYWWELPFILLGILGIIRMKMSPSAKGFLFIWFLSGPLPAAITTQAPHAMRSYTFLPTWQIFGAVGIIACLQVSEERLKRINQGYRMVGYGILGFIVMIGSLLQLYKNYFFIFPRQQSSSFQYALSQAIPYVLAHESAYDRIVFSNQNDLYQSYMFFLFFSHYDPKEYRKRGGTVSGGFAQTHTIGKYVFRPIDWKKEQKNRSTLYVGNIADFPDATASLANFSNLDGILAIRIAAGNE